MRYQAVALIRCGVALWVLSGLLLAPAWAADSAERAVGVAPPSSAGSQAVGVPFDFDIPAQPLVAALNRYASLTLLPALFSSEMVSGRTSSAIRGRFSPEAALHLLLEGTGLAAEKITAGPADAFILKPAPVAAPPVSPIQTALARAGDYPRLLQVRLWDALCDDTRTKPGDYRALLRFEVDGVGQIREVQLLGSTGNAKRDAAVRTILERVRMDAPPPPGMPQPLTMIVLPSEPGRAGAAPHCESGAS